MLRITNVLELKYLKKNEIEKKMIQKQYELLKK